MRLSEIRLFGLHIPFKRELSHNLFSRNKSDALIAVVKDESGWCGLGEGTPRSFVTGEQMSAGRSAAIKLAGMLAGETIGCLTELRDVLTHTGGKDIARRHPAAWCTLETACLDLWAKRHRRPLWNLFGRHAGADRMHYSAVLPLIDGVRELQKMLRMVKSIRPPGVKIKVADVREGIARFRHVRRVLGPDLPLRVDANGAFSADQSLAFLEGTLPFGIQAFEQPVSKEDLDGLARVAAASPVPVIADESLYTGSEPELLIDSGICQGINLRLSSCGGILRSLDLVERARARGLLWQLGAHVGESAILSLAARQFAAVCSDYGFLEGSFSTYVLKEDLCKNDIGFGVNGMAELPKGPGLGVEIDFKRLKRWTELLAVVT
jgi:muconate cycloisomerase